jgi:hypothetical protein
MSLLNFFYLYCAAGILVAIALYMIHKNKEKDISEIVHDKIHEMSNDGSFSFHSANFIGHLLAYCFSMLFWPILIIKNILSK